MSIRDFKLDKDQLKGRSIELRGHLAVFGDMTMLRAEVMDMSPVLMDMKGVSRDQRRRVLERCDTGCEVTVRGKVATVLFQIGIIAEEVIVE